MSPPFARPVLQSARGWAPDPSAAGRGFVLPEGVSLNGVFTGFVPESARGLALGQRPAGARSTPARQHVRAVPAGGRESAPYVQIVHEPTTSPGVHGASALAGASVPRATPCGAGLCQHGSGIGERAPP